MNLLERLQLAEKRGLTGFTLWKSSTGWQANAQFNKGGWHICTDPDMETAVLGVLKYAKSYDEKKSHAPLSDKELSKKEKRRLRRLERKKRK